MTGLEQWERELLEEFLVNDGPVFDTVLKALKVIDAQCERISELETVIALARKNSEKPDAG